MTRQANMRLSLTRPQHVSLALYDVAGRRIAKLIDAKLGIGTHDVAWNPGARVSAGVYFARLVTEDGASTRRLVVLR